MRQNTLSILVFGDQAGDHRTTLLQVLLIKNNPILTSLFERVYLALRDEVAKQPRCVREEIPGFSSLADLIARYYDPDQAKLNSLESALTCISQTACFICYQTKLDTGYPLASECRILGFCTGLLSAVAVSLARSLVELIPLAVEVVRIAFRMGAAVSEVQEKIEPRSDDPLSSGWSAVVSGIQEEEAISVLDEFHQSACIPRCSQVYLSAISPSTLTLSGPNLVLGQLLQTTTLKDLKPVRLPIYGPYHAAHLYNTDDLQSLVLPMSREIAEKPDRACIPLLSTGAKEWFYTSNFCRLMKEVLRDILISSLHWNDVLEALVSSVKESANAECSIVLMGPSSAGQSLVSALKQNHELDVSLNDQFLAEHFRKQSAQASDRLADSKIAVCGLAGRFPDAVNHETFWKLLEQGLDLHREIPKDRFDIETHVDKSGKKANTSYTPFGCFIDEPGLFDPRFFNISPREATQTDPMQRLALVTAYEALEMSGYVPNRTPSTQLDRVGTFYGQTSDDWREIQEAQNIDTYFIPGGVRAFGPGRINYYFKFSGPSYSIDTACSSSLAAIQLACTSLRAGDCDTALAGGMNVLTNPDIFSGLSRGQFLSKKGSCQTFDDGADGYCRADGVGTVILKRLEDAQADKDPILAVILGSATNHSANAVSITHPHVGAQEFLYKKVLSACHVDPHDVSYVEMHGTGTQAGDATEMQSVTNTFAPARRRRHLDQKLYLGAVKANSGHAEAASGITSLVKVLMMMEKSIIPPHCGIKESINHTFPADLEERNVHLAYTPTHWRRPENGKRVVFLNNFSAAGGNTALLLEDAPLPGTGEEKSRDPRSTHIVALSAKSQFSLNQNVKSLIRLLDDVPATNLASLAYTTTARRTQHNHRVTLSGSDTMQIRNALASLKEQNTRIPPKKPDIVFVFTGQGSHYPKMAKQLFDDSVQFRADIKKFDAIGKIQGFPSILPVVDGSLPDTSLTPSMFQLGAICVQLALSRLWASWGVVPQAVVGHSLGEYAALHVAGVLSISDTIYMVGKRAKLLEDRCYEGSHVMLAIKGSVAAVGQYLSTVELACINAPEETVVSGTNTNIDLLSTELKDRGFKSTKLPIPFAFHSAQVGPILDDFEAAAKGVAFASPRLPIISPLLSEVITKGGTFGASYLKRHCRETVNFLGGIEASKHAGVVTDESLWLEIGSHPLCSAMIKATLGPSTRTASSLRRKEDNWRIIASSLCSLHDAGINIDWSEYHRPFDSVHELLRLPTYCWDNKNYWIDYKNDWCLTKGDPAAVAELFSSEPKSKLSTTSVQRIVEESIKEDSATIVVESDIAEPDLQEAIMGHEVNGLGLCPPSLYADMALVITDYLYKQWKTDAEQVDINVCNMKVEKALIGSRKGPQLIRVAVTANFTAKEAQLTFYSVSSEGKKTTTHAQCGVKYEDAESWLASWKRSSYLINTRIESLMNGAKNGKMDLITRGMAYKLFGGLIKYGQKYRGMEEVILDSSQLEATSSVVFQATEEDGNFYRSPYWTDSVAHLSGFVMLANEKADPATQVYVSHGWENYRVARPLSADKAYRAYVRMQPTSPNVVIGDLYVFEGTEIVAVVEGLQFHCLPRSLLDSILATASGRRKGTSPPAATQPPTPKSNDGTGRKPKVASTAPSLARKKPHDLISRTVKIITDEVGIQPTELSDGSVFAELGIDSLLSLTVTGEMREILGIEVASTLFDECPTLKDLKRYLKANDEGDSVSETNSDESASVDNSTTTTTTSPGLDVDSASSAPEEDDITVCGDSKTVNLIRSTIASEMDMDPGEISSSTDLAEIGMDSLMSLSVLSKLREDTNEEISSEFFAENSTFGAIEEHYGVKQRNTNSKPSSLNETTTTRRPLATSVLLQASPTPATTLFLLPDGSGSATSYAALPPIPNTTIYALSSPFLSSISSYTCSLETLTALFITEIRRRQPRGPYVLGGWSAGGVIAYEATVQLLRLGESVEKLFLIDAPCPTTLADGLPTGLHNWFNSQGLLGLNSNATGTPPWLLPHFDASIRALSSYCPSPLPPSPFPHVHVLWATDGVYPFPDSARPDLKEVKGNSNAMWLLENRQDFGAGGWEELVGGRVRGVERVEGANHFTVMRKGWVERVGAFIGKAVGRL